MGYNGIININKPAGMTSHTVVSKIKTKYKTKAGHCGTLDPDATGVLPVLVGSATGACSFLTEKDKEYRAGIRLGVRTDTLDMTGEVLYTHPSVPGYGEFLACIPFFTGEIVQVPPMYSAIKIGGKKLVDLARQGIEIEREGRIVTVSKLSPFILDGKIFLDIECSKGTYIRTLCSDIGEYLGCGAAMDGLVRTRSGIFTIEASVPLETVLNSDEHELEKFIIPTDHAFPDIPSVKIPEEYDKLYRNGAYIPAEKIISPNSFTSGQLMKVYDKDGFHSLCELRYIDENPIIKVKKFF